MRIRIAKRSLPRHLSTKHPNAGIVAEADIKAARTNLRCKLVVFRSSTALRNFWPMHVGSTLSRNVLGVARSGRDRDGFRWVDRRYFCVIGLVVGKLSVDTIVHECGHAAIAFAERLPRYGWPENTDEERICYPLGIITEKVNNFLHAEGLLER